MLTLDKIYHAQYVLKDATRNTDIIYSPVLSEQSGCEVYLKTENLQLTGSFKIRGAYYKISQLSEAEKAKGVIACSAGNHAQGVAPLRSSVSKPKYVCPTARPFQKSKPRKATAQR